MNGRVVAFDAHVGRGVIERADGERLPFHCIEIMDGSRTVDVDAVVEFDTIAKLGRYEAASIRTVLHVV